MIRAVMAGIIDPDLLAVAAIAWIQKHRSVEPKGNGDGLKARKR